jgi:hypothetical protein
LERSVAVPQQDEYRVFTGIRHGEIQLSIAIEIS